jgi:hypothetical protein
MAVAFVGVAVMSFLVGRTTAPSDDSNGSPVECAPEPLTQANLPDGFAETGNVGYFSLCEKRAAAQANDFGEPFPPIEMYGDPEGTKVIGMWYGDCGYPEGLVQPDAGRPSCTGVVDTEP